MITAVDSSVLFAILKNEPRAEQWMDLLVRNAALGELCICEVVAAEVGAYFGSAKSFHETLEKLTISLDHLTLNACYHAGHIFRQYREEGGKRTALIPDFLVGAHATIQADCLLAADRGYLKRYFSKLKVIELQA